MGLLSSFRFYRLNFDRSCAWNFIIPTCRSAWQGSAVPCRLLHTGHRRCRQAACQVRHTATAGGATTSAIHSRPPRNSLPDDLRAQEDYESFSQGLKTWLSLGTSVFSALETFVTIALYKSTFTIPYHTAWVVVISKHCFLLLPVTVFTPILQKLRHYPRTIITPLCFRYLYFPLTVFYYVLYCFTI